jgi:hypothetical protein
MKGRLQMAAEMAQWTDHTSWILRDFRKPAVVEPADVFDDGELDPRGQSRR